MSDLNPYDLVGMRKAAEQGKASHTHNSPKFHADCPACLMRRHDVEKKAAEAPFFLVKVVRTMREIARRALEGE